MTSFIQNVSTACGWLGSWNVLHLQSIPTYTDPSSKLCRQRHQLWFLWSYWRWQRISSAFARLLPSPPGSGRRGALLRIRRMLECLGKNSMKTGWKMSCCSRRKLWDIGNHRPLLTSPKIFKPQVQAKPILSYPFGNVPCHPTANHLEINIINITTDQHHLDILKDTESNYTALNCYFVIFIDHACSHSEAFEAGKFNLFGPRPPLLHRQSPPPSLGLWPATDQIDPVASVGLRESSPMSHHVSSSPKSMSKNMILIEKKTNHARNSSTLIGIPTILANKIPIGNLCPKFIKTSHGKPTSNSNSNIQWISHIPWFPWMIKTQQPKSGPSS